MADVLMLILQVTVTVAIVAMTAAMIGFLYKEWKRF